MSRRNLNVAAVVLAAGRGERMGGYKQFYKILGRSVISYSLDRLMGMNFLRTIVVVAPEARVSYVRSLFKNSDKRIRVIAGGKTRKHSTRLALRYIKQLPDPCDYVVIHDAARPCITQKMIQEVYRLARKFGNATIAIPVLDLTSLCLNGFVTRSLKKSDTFAISTPQCFKFELLWRAHKLSPGARPDLDNIELVERLSPTARIKTTTLFYPNPKFTHPQDLALIEGVLKQRSHG